MQYVYHYTATDPRWGKKASGLYVNDEPVDTHEKYDDFLYYVAAAHEMREPLGLIIDSFSFLHKKL